VPAKQKGPLAYVVDNIVLRTAAYYVVLFAVAAGLSRLPGAQEVMRDSMDALLSGSTGFPGVGRSAAVQAASDAELTATTLTITVAAAMLGAILLALPVAWIYTLTRQKRGYQQSVVQTLMVLPPLVAGVVVLVKYSLALAFSLAGIVAAVRFRNTLEDSKDTVYVFLAIAIGLAAAVQLPVAAVISVIFNMLALVLWLTDFGKSAAYEGVHAERKMEEARQRMRQTGSFVALLDNEIFENMTPEQLEVAADRAWKRRRKMDPGEPEEDEMQRRDVLLRVRIADPASTRSIIESVYDEFMKKWRYVGVVHEKDGTHYVEYAVQLKKTARSQDLLDALYAKSQVLEAVFK
jgi:hypothetical protein